MNLLVPPGSPLNWSTPLKDNFYKAFEAYNRGSRKSIKEKLKVYLPFILPLHTQYPEETVIDIGCGRGEWLELMRDKDIPAKGIDLDSGMLDEARILELSVEEGDGVELLRREPDESALAVTAFHVVEHIQFETLQILVQEALRVLKPGGILILETPNPENIRVSGEYFYIDPTHKKPIPSQLLSFLPEHYGFSRTKVLYVNENEYLRVQQYASLHQVLEGVSQDYAVVAQKKAASNIISLTDTAFNKKYGQHLHEMLEKFERRMLRFEELVENVVMKADTSIDKSEESIWKAETVLHTFDSQFAELREKTEQAHRHTKKAQEYADSVWHHYQLVVNSRSWKITRPLRLFTHLLRTLKEKSKLLIRQFLFKLKNRVNTHPSLKRNIIRILDWFPALKTKLKQISSTSGQKPITDTELYPHIEAPKPFVPSEEDVLKDLQKAIEKRDFS